MQFTLLTVFAAVAASVAAVPTGNTFMRRGCDIAGCVEKLGGTAVSCGSAAAQLGADPFSDAGCIIAAINVLGPNLPAQCDGCASEFVKSAPAQKVEGALGGAANTVENGVESAADKVGSFFSGLF